jgi:hypothetical protein
MQQAAVTRLLGSTGKGSVSDKLRLLGLYCLAARPSAADVAELETALREGAAPAELSEVTFLRTTLYYN